MAGQKILETAFYALMALKGAKNKYLLDILYPHSKRNMAENIYLALKSSLQ
ncbi:hypothetical protein VP01_655g10 [Puccinia sorghi]|uniref:Uncharacterized protein n=1 Tax=Puccinia sorghi TaxID=27349 RepID=A0A0L6UFC3_9BASI|nr:hypothetical protein VP01_655g10 [Puccinia sorghi]